jgi:hypothetical protein
LKKYQKVSGKPFEKRSLDRSFDKKPFEKRSFEKKPFEKKPFEKRTSDQSKPVEEPKETPVIDRKQRKLLKKQAMQRLLNKE